MTLYEYLKQNKAEELVVHDTDYDCESYWDYYTESECKTDLWDNSLMELAKKLDIVAYSEYAVDCDISDLIERNIKNIAEADLFDINETEEIMGDFDNIIAGYVSENWFKKFVDCLE